jgi:hypothetical protein
MADRAAPQCSSGWEEQATPGWAGWIHMILGVIVALAGFGLLAGRTWARAVGITLAVLSAIANFMFIPYHPFWALLVIALDVFVIWALAAHGGELRDERV